jgi:hypothetical protein
MCVCAWPPAFETACRTAMGLKIFMQLVPCLLDWMCFFAGYVSESSMDFAVVKLFYAFQVFLQSLLLLLLPYSCCHLVR